MTELSFGAAAALAAISLVAGVGITAVGPGGVFLTVALYVLTDLPPERIAGTALATFVVTGVLGSYVYLRSGELRAGAARDLAVVLSATAVAGALVGARANLLLAPGVFGPLLAVFTTSIGATVLYRGLRGRVDVDRLASVSRWRQHLRVGVTGALVGVVCALLGVGGPVVAVPVLVLLGVPMLLAVAVAQVQSVFLAAGGTLGYALAGAVSAPLALLVGLPQLVGVVVGWRLAHRVDQRRLRIVLGAVLVVLGPLVLAT